MNTARQLCTFFLDDLCFGVEVEKVQEVIRFQPMTPVPLAPPAISGLIHLRGQIVTAIDLRRRLDLPARDIGHAPVNVVIRADECLVSLLVDEIGEVEETHEEAFERPPETLRGEARRLIRGAYKLADRLLLLLDTERAACVNA